MASKMNPPKNQKPDIKAFKEEFKTLMENQKQPEAEKEIKSLETVFVPGGGGASVPGTSEVVQPEDQQKKIKHPVVETKKRDSDDNLQALDPELQEYVGEFEGDEETGWHSLLEDDPTAMEIESEEEEDEDEDEGEEGEEEEEVDESLSEEEVLESKFAWHPSEEGFKQSDLASRKKRRYVLGTHSFLELADPGLERSLVPGTGEDENLSHAEKVRRGLKAEKDLYKDLCKQSGIAPNATFMQSLGSSVLDLTRHGLTEKEVEAICKTLYTDTHFKVVLLGGNAAGYEGGMAIAGMIENNDTIEVLNLSNTEILEAIEPICSAVGLNISLISLDLSKNELGDQEMKYVGLFLEENQMIERLNLSYNEIKDAGLNEIGYGMDENSSIMELDLSDNLIKGEKSASYFFTACSEHPQLRRFDLRRNVIRNDGAKGIGRMLQMNDKIEYLDLSFNIMEEPAGPPLGKSLNSGPRELETLNLDHQWWTQGAAAAVLKPFGNSNNAMPIKLIDFGYMLDVHKGFLKAKERTMALHPDLVIIHGEPYGMNKAKGPDPTELVIRRANIVCQNFETPLVMLMEELATEKKKLTTTEFRKFIKSCNLYKDKSLTDAFEKVFPSGSFDVDAEAIIAAFDKEYPGLRKIPDPEPEGEPKEEAPKKKAKKGKGKGKGKKGKGGSKKAKSKKK